MPKILIPTGPGGKMTEVQIGDVEAAPVLLRLAPLAFRRRFTPTERAAIEWAAVDKPEQSAQERMGSAALRSSLKDQDQASYIDLDDLDTIAGTHAIEQLGLIAAGRADEILTAPVEPGERP